MTLNRRENGFLKEANTNNVIKAYFLKLYRKLLEF